jgi:hypothetical protein
MKEKYYIEEYDKNVHERLREIAVKCGNLTLSNSSVMFITFLEVKTMLLHRTQFVAVFLLHRYNHASGPCHGIVHNRYTV